MKTRLHVNTRGQGLYEITDDVRKWLSGKSESGLLTLFLRHTSASLLIQENADPDVRVDLEAFLSRLVPPANDPTMDYLRHTVEGPDDMPAHIKAAFLPAGLSIPVENGVPLLGRWQGIYLFEHRDAPHDREIALHFRADP